MKIRKITHKGKTCEIHETPTKLEVKEEGDTRWTRISNLLRSWANETNS